LPPPPPHPTPPPTLFFIIKHQPSNAWTSSAMPQTTTQLMDQFPAPRSLYPVRGSLDQIFVSHSATHTYIVKPSETGRSLWTTWTASERFASSAREACPSTVYMYSSLQISVIKWDWQKHNQWNQKSQNSPVMSNAHLVINTHKISVITAKKYCLLSSG